MALKRELRKFWKGTLNNWSYFSNITTAKKISKYENVHLMFNDKFNKPLIDFFNKYFDNGKHCFIFIGGYSEKNFKIPEGKNIFKSCGYKNLGLDNKNIKRIILHGIFSKYLVKSLYKNSPVLNKSYWVIWGGDLYSVSKFIKDKDQDFIFKHNLKGYVTPVKGDFDIASELYDFKGRLYPCLYISPTRLETLNEAKQNKAERDYTVIQIEHSADESILEILKKLERFKDKPIKIRTVLSYGQKNFNDQIIALGNNIFGEKFTAITEYMPPEEYSNVLANTDILIMNQKRQQGITNIRALLYLGAKIYIRKDISTWDFLTNDEFKIFDTLNLDNETYESFIKYDDTNKDNNIDKALRFFDEEYIASLWKNIFNS